MARRVSGRWYRYSHQVTRHARTALGNLALLICLALTGCAAAHAQTAPTPTRAVPMSTESPTASPTPQPTRTQYPLASCVKPSAPARTFAASALKQAFVVTPNDVTTCALLSLVIPAPASAVPHVAGQLILVSIRQQWLWAYQDGRLVMASPVTTGMPYLRTPQGSFAVRYKVENTWFYSPWPPGSPWYYTPEHVNFALYFRDLGFFIHDAPWRHYFGPGTNVPHTNPDGSWETGSHGCVNMPTAAGQWLYRWARAGTAIAIQA